MTVLDRIENFEGNLTVSDRRLTKIFLTDPGEAAYLSSTEIAKKADVHPATAVRLAKKLGFPGYPELRSCIREDIAPDNGAERMKLRLERMADDSVFRMVVESEIQALQSIADHITQAKIEEATDAIIAADRIAVFGVGHATSLADLVVRRLNRSGYRTRATHHIDWEIAEMLSWMKPGSLLIAFAYRSVPKGMSDLIANVRERGGKIILISDLIGPMVRPVPDVVLAASRGTDGSVQSLNVPMVICNTLMLELAKRDGGRSVEALEDLAETRKSLAAQGKDVGL